MKTAELRPDGWSLGNETLLNNDDPVDTLQRQATVLKDSTKYLYDLIDMIEDYQFSYGQQINIALRYQNFNILIDGPDELIDQLIKLKLADKWNEE